MKENPTIIIGWPIISQLAHGLPVILENATLLPDDLLSNTAQQIINGNFNTCDCHQPREVICNGHKCGTCGQIIDPSGVREHSCS